MKGLGLRECDAGAGGRYRVEAGWVHRDVELCCVRVEARTGRKMVFGIGMGVMVMMIKGQERDWGVREAG